MKWHCNGIVIAMLLVGCGTAPKPQVQVQTVEVKVPVPVKRPCPDSICREFKPSCTLPVFSSDPANPKNAVLSEEDQRKLRCYISDMNTWGSAMRAFLMAP